MAIFEVSSRDKRVIKTMENINYGMENTNNNTENISDGKENISDNIGKKIKYYRNITLKVLTGSNLPKEFQDEWRNRIESGGNEEVNFKQFLNGERSTKPEMVAREYISILGNLFKRAIKKNRKITVVSFRHGDKDSEGNLSKEGEIQSQELGKRLKDKLDNKGDTILAATHNVINETIINTIFSDEKLPEEWKNLLDFTETVTYTFYPIDQNNDEPYLEIDWRGTQKQISYKKFKELMEKISK